MVGLPEYDAPVAYTVPETLASLDSRVMPGERKVFVALRDHLPEDYLVYYDIPVDGWYPDFIIVGPDLGLVVLLLGNRNFDVMRILDPSRPPD